MLEPTATYRNRARSFESLTFRRMKGVVAIDWFHSRPSAMTNAGPHSPVIVTPHPRYERAACLEAPAPLRGRGRVDAASAYFLPFFFGPPEEGY